MHNENRKEVELQEALSYASMLTRKIRGLPESKEIYIRVYLHGGDDFYISGWASWPDSHTGRILVFFECKDKCIVTEFRNVEKIEFLYAKPEGSKAIGFVTPTEEVKVPPTWCKWLTWGEIEKDSKIKENNNG